MSSGYCGPRGTPIGDPEKFKYFKSAKVIKTIDDLEDLVRIRPKMALIITVDPNGTSQEG